MENFETVYKNSLINLISHGHTEHNRTGIDTCVQQHQFFEIDDCSKNFPKLRGKKVYPYMALKELIWMLKGRTDVKWLDEHGVTYWDEWQNEKGSIGRTYGYQFRNFNGCDQLEYITDQIIKSPESRRILLSLWNPVDLKDMELPPCQYTYHFSCEETDISKQGKPLYRIHLHCVMRSADSFLGVPYNFMYDAWFLYIICKYCTCQEKSKNVYEPGNIYMTCDNYHIYKNHFPQAVKYIMNVEENMNDVIGSASVIGGLDQLQNKFHDIDSFIDYIEEDLPLHKQLYYISEIPDVYGSIKADIAV